MTTDCIGYQNPKFKLETIYTIEYLNNKKDADRVFSGRENAPWELYKTKTFTDLSAAISLFINMYARLDIDDIFNCIYDVKLFEEIKLNGETIQERYITDLDNFGSITDLETRNIRNRNFELSDTVKNQNNELETMEKFLEAYHAKDAYKQFKEPHNTETA